MTFVDFTDEPVQEEKEEEIVYNMSDMLTEYDEHAEISSTDSLSLVSLSSDSSTNSNPAPCDFPGWKVVTRKGNFYKPGNF
jgi:hypothetical protein